MFIVSYEVEFLLFSECGTFTIFSLHNKWTVNLHKYNDDTELVNTCETLLNCVAVAAHDC